MATLRTSKIGTENFGYHKDIRTFTEELSTIGHRMFRNMRQRLYNDACDEGFVLVSHRTGKEVQMYQSKTETNDEGETLCWEFEPCVTDQPNPGFDKLVIFND